MNDDQRHHTKAWETITAALAHVDIFDETVTGYILGGLTDAGLVIRATAPTPEPAPPDLVQLKVDVATIARMLAAHPHAHPGAYVAAEIAARYRGITNP